LLDIKWFEAERASPPDTGKALNTSTEHETTGPLARSMPWRKLAVLAWHVLIVF
jgi:hypothetical protein